MVPALAPVSARPDSPVRAVLLDGMGTLVALEDPVPPLRAELRERFGLLVDEPAARSAVAAEIAYYRAHHLEGRDEVSLAGLRRRCATELAGALGAAAQRLPADEVAAALLASLRFSPHDDAPGALERLEAMGLRLVVASNWDVGLAEVLERTGLARRLRATITSAEVGVAKPARAIFDRALAAAGVPAVHAVHCGDSLCEDVAGARAAGIRPILIDRGGSSEPSDPGVPTIASLAALPGVVEAMGAGRKAPPRTLG